MNRKNNNNKPRNNKRKKEKIYSVSILFDGFPNIVEAVVKTNGEISSVIDDIVSESEITKGASYVSSVAYERKEGAFVSIDKIRVRCPVCLCTYFVYSFNSIHVDPLGYMELICDNPKCGSKFLLDRKTVK